MHSSAYDKQGRRKYLTSAECRRFSDAAGNCSPIETAFCLTLLYTGCRISEALGLKPDDIDWESSVMMIRTLKKRNKEVTRRVPIPPVLVEKLRRMAMPTPSERLWSYSRSTGYRLIKRTLQDTGVEGIHACPKGLRHAFGVRCAMNRVPLHLIRDWMGHADESTTAIYLDVRDEEERTLIMRTWKF